MALAHIKRHKISYGLLAVVLAVAIMLRLYLSLWLTGYVNRVLADLGGYRGSIESLEIDLYRGAYKIKGLRIDKMNRKFPVPFASAEDIDLSLQWGALFHGRIVSDITMVKPVINFAIDKTGMVSQTGQEIDWTSKIKDLMPIDINKVSFTEGKLTYKDFSSNPNVNMYIINMVGDVQNLRNVVDKEKPLPSIINVSGESIGKGKFTLKARANILKNIPDFDADTKLEKVDLPALNTYTDAYASIDFNAGTFSVYSELQSKNNRLSGYIKPIATNIHMIDLKRNPNPLKLIWESVVSVVVDIFQNQRKDQFATRIEVSGSLDNIETSTWSAIGGILRNAFIKAFDRKLGRE